MKHNARSEWGPTQQEVKGLLPDVPGYRRQPKNTKQWCKGKVGREHVPEIVVPENAWDKVERDGSTLRKCGWIERRYYTNNEWMPEYHCNHAEVCKNCGKVLRRSPWLKSDGKFSIFREECPLYTPREEV